MPIPFVLVLILLAIVMAMPLTYFLAASSKAKQLGKDVDAAEWRRLAKTVGAATAITALVIVGAFLFVASLKSQ